MTRGIISPADPESAAVVERMATEADVDRLLAVLRELEGVIAFYEFSGGTVQ